MNHEAHVAVIENEFPKLSPRPQVEVGPVPTAPLKQNLLTKVGKSLIKNAPYMVPEAHGAAIMTAQEIAHDEQQIKERTSVRVDPSEVVEGFNQFNFVKQVPKFSDQLADQTRSNTFQTATEKTMTESSGLKQLDEYLLNIVSRLQPMSGDPGAANTIFRAQKMRENLSFIGEKEYREASKGLSEYWKAYLDMDPANQICVQTNISYGERVKSDLYLFERILEHFSEEELLLYEGRLVTQLNELTTNPKNAKIVMLDDWTISGTQISDAIYNLFGKQAEASKYENCVEVDLMIASPKRIQLGFDMMGISWTSDSESKVIPVKAYYQAHSSPETSTHQFNKAVISGIHSSVDYDFEELLKQLRSEYSLYSGKDLSMPALSLIKRPYRNSRLPRVSRIRRQTDQTELKMTISAQNIKNKVTQNKTDVEEELWL